MKRQPNKQFILDSLAAMARAVGRPPSRSEFLSHSGISEDGVLKFFPSWNAALQAAGLAPYTHNLRLDDRELLEAWGHAVRENGKAPASRAYRHLGKFDHRTIERRFGPWSTLPQVFRDFARGKPAWADVLALLPPSPAQPSPKRLSDAAPDFVPGPASRGASYPRVALEFLPARFSPPNRSCPRSSKLRYRPLRGRPTYGQPMDFRGLRHEPVNEQGVVLLFGMVAKELGYIVEAVQSGFPDCEAKRQIAPQRWQRVHLEFEFESRNFRDHGHSLTGCDVIVCWRHNWPDCPPHLEILELSSLLQFLPSSDA
jgi:hypothetical protein